MRRLVMLAWSVSLALCVVTAAVWVRSHFRADEAGWGERGRDGTRGRNVVVVATSNCGRLAVHYQWYEDPVRPSTEADWPRDGETVRTRWLDPFDPSPGSNARFGRLGFSYGAIVRPDLVSRLVVVPHWSVCVLALIVPACAWASAARRRRRFPPGACRACGYDLRATPGRCPECGRAGQPPLPTTTTAQ